MGTSSRLHTRPIRVTLLKLPTAHMHFLVEHPTHRCVVCQKRRPEFICERCGARLHGDCHWKRLATPWERMWIESPYYQTDGPNLIFLCPGCRS